MRDNTHIQSHNQNTFFLKNTTQMFFFHIRFFVLLAKNCNKKILGSVFFFFSVFSPFFCVLQKKNAELRTYKTKKLHPKTPHKQQNTKKKVQQKQNAASGFICALICVFFLFANILYCFKLF